MDKEDDNPSQLEELKMEYIENWLAAMDEKLESAFEELEAAIEAWKLVDNDMEWNIYDDTMPWDEVYEDYDDDEEEEDDDNDDEDDEEYDDASTLHDQEEEDTNCNDYHWNEDEEEEC